MNYLNFNKNHLLNFDEIVKYFDAILPNDKGDIISQKLKHYCYVNEDYFYRISDNITYIEHSKLENELLVIAQDLISSSIKALSVEQSTLLSKLYKKAEYKQNVANSEVQKFQPQLKSALRKDIVLNTYKHQIHFLNGYVDLKDLKFKQRKVNEHFVSKVINRNYKQSTQEQRTKLMKTLTKIYPNTEDRNTILMAFGSALSGDSKNDQSMLFLLGLGSSGKSFIMSLLKLAFECYVKELQSNTFMQNNAKIDKIMNSFSNDPQTLVSWINELKDAKIDSELMKKFVEGMVQTTKLFKEGDFQVSHISKIFFTSNVMPNIQIDTGIIRRFKSYEHKSSFTEDPKLVDEKNNIHLVVKDLHKKMNEEGLLDAFVDILLKRSYRFLKGENIEYGDAFKDCSKTIISANDHMQDFVDSMLVLTHDKNDIIGKDDLLEVYLAQNPNRRLSPLQLISIMKDKKIKYDCEKRYGGGKKGVFIGIKYKGDNSVEEDKTEINTFTKENDNLKAEIEMLKLKLKEFEEQCKTKQQVNDVLELEDIDEFEINKQLQRLSNKGNDLVFTKTKKEKKIKPKYKFKPEPEVKVAEEEKPNKITVREDDFLSDSDDDFL